MQKQIIEVKGMSCEHCVNAVTDAVKKLPGVGSVEVSLKENTAAVEFDPDKVTIAKIKEEIEDQGYDVCV
jgi:copper chaperone